MNARDYGWFAKTKAWVTYHTIVRAYSFLEKYSVLQSDKVINHYASADEILVKQFGVDRKKLVQIPYYIDLVKRISPQEEEVRKLVYAKPMIVLICRHDGRKGINFLLHAFALLNKRRVQYTAVLIGSGKLLDAHRRMAVGLSLSNVHILGFVADPEYYLKNADIFVFPSVEEGSSSISILEAMKYGIPVVSTNVDGIPEDIEHGISGILVPPFQSVALADALEKCLKNPALLKKLGAGGKKQFERRNNKAMVKRKLQAFLQSLILRNYTK